MSEKLVYIWWTGLCAIGLLNIILWFYNRNWLTRQKERWTPQFFKARHQQMLLAAGYVFGCAFRSFFPRADVQRICLLDSWISSVAIGRSVATIAELCFVMQWSLMLRELAEAANNQKIVKLSRYIVPMIFIAECFSWYATLTTNYLGNAIEESIWDLTGVLLVLSLIVLRPAFNARVRSAIVLSMIGGILYCAFMSLVDVPMYITRHHADELANRSYLSLLMGVQNVCTFWSPTQKFVDWQTEIPWMTLYFSFAVWLSIALIRVPNLKNELREKS